jgi:rubrerythrin
MNFKSIQEILDFAVQREEEAAASYARLREAARDAAFKELLSELENEEKKHRQLLLGLSGLTPESLAVKPVADMMISDYLVAEPPRADMTFQDLLIVAAQKEQKAVDLYTELRRRVSDTVHMALFDFLIMQEKNHKLKLESEYEKHVLVED